MKLIVAPSSNIIKGQYGVCKKKKKLTKQNEENWSKGNLKKNLSLFTILKTKLFWTEIRFGVLVVAIQVRINPWI